MTSAHPDRSTAADLRQRVADMLTKNDACGTGPLSRAEYLDDADALVALILGGAGSYTTALWAQLDERRDERDRWIERAEAAETDRERLRWAATEALERVEVEDCVTAELILSRVVSLDGTILAPGEAETRDRQ